MTDTIALVFDIDDTLYRQIDLLQSACEAVSYTHLTLPTIA